MTTQITSPRGQKMIGYLAKEFYQNNDEFTALIQSEGQEFDKLKQAIDEILDQFYVRTATWGLGKWELELGLIPVPELTNQERQDRIVSRLRGTGTATINIVKQVAESYEKGAIEVAEDHAAYTIYVLFVDTVGIPSNINDLKAAVRAVVPANLAIEYQYKYNTYAVLSIFNHNALIGYTHEQLRTSKI